LSLESKLLEIQKSLPALKKSAANPHFKSSYVPLEALMEEILPVLNEAGILLVQAPSYLGADLASLTTQLVDTETSERLSFTVPLVLDKQTPQAVGSAITYMRRYSLMSILGMIGEPDTDAEAAMNRQGQPVSASKGTRAPRATSTPSHNF
jgi:hypothetical protein